MTAGKQRLEADDEYRLVVSILQALPPRYRRAIVLRELDGCSYDEMAALEGVSVQSVRSVLHRARVAFRRAYLDMTAESLEGERFYEEDEPVADVRAAFRRGAKGTTGRRGSGEGRPPAVLPDARV
jgi:hypothetical protein